MRPPIYKSFDECEIDVEIDLSPKGSPIKLTTIGDFRAWRSDESAFWKWTVESPGQELLKSIGGDIHNKFWAYDQRLETLESSLYSDWTHYIQSHEIRSSSELFSDTEEEKLAIELLDQLDFDFRQKIDSFSTNARHHLHQEISILRQHISRSEPFAHFLKRLLVENFTQAVYAFEYFLLSEQGLLTNRIQRVGGQVHAMSFLNGFTDLSADYKSAYNENLELWNKDLMQFRNSYVDSKKSFEALEGDIKTEIKILNDRSNTFSKSHEKLLYDNTNLAAKDLEDARIKLLSLTETYEKHLQLKGPMIYWNEKLGKHEKQIANLRIWLVISSFIGLGLIWLAAYSLLPENHPSGTVPWRPIGIFLIISTFIIWFIKLLIKIFLSNVHLAADASERVVMINTFMALIRKKNDEGGITSADMMAILSPIFRPSTTGVISDEGGPVTITDVLSRISGGK